MKLNRKFCRIYHTVLVVLHLVGGCVWVIVTNIYEQGSLAEGVLLGIFTIIGGTACFFFLPLFFVAVSFFTRFFPVAAIPVFVIFWLGTFFGDTNNFESLTVLEGFFLSIGLSLFGWFNIATAVEANKDEDFNSIMILNG